VTDFRRELRFGYFLVWSGERNLRFDGAHYRLAGAQSGPVPAHPIGIWLGVYGPRALDLTARLADGWVPSLRGDTGQIAVLRQRLDERAAAHGRDPGDIRRILNVNGQIEAGSVQRWADELTALAVEQGFDTFVLWADGPDQLARFAEEVGPAVRTQVAAERSQ
jgi:alkanesulfonate monooxygenase SsuD/methylene tetrahydromethanopterin reductase-like flavin-dependent oxidoreductase (luciferase family)